MTNTEHRTEIENKPMITKVYFDYYLNFDLIQGESDNVEDVILNYRKALKRRCKADRPERGTLRYKIGNGEWFSAS